jgi:putative flippase GtrA
MISKINPRFQPLVKRLIGFANVGLIMTAASAVVLYLLLEMLQWQVYTAYSIVYLLSIFVSYMLNARLVFKKSFSWIHLGAFYLAYFSGMLFGLAMILVLKSHLDYSDFVNSCLMIPITVAWNFVFATIIFDKLRASVQRPGRS